MKTIIENYNREQFEVELYFTNKFQGRGGWDVVLEIEYKNNKKTIKTYTTDADFIDDLREDVSFEEKQNMYFDKFFTDFDEIILEWIEEINEENN
jgi:hypothetical protein